jgi:hypothetical protein
MLKFPQGESGVVISGQSAGSLAEKLSLVSGPSEIPCISEAT